MKKNVIFLLSLFLSVMVLGQNQSAGIKAVNNEAPPKFLGSQDFVSYLKTDNSVLINDYLQKNFVCPKQAAECCVEGTEVVQFTVSPIGKITDIKVINSVCPEIDKEVIRVLKTMDGMWQPGLEKGEPVAMDSEIAVMLGDYPTKSIMAKRFTEKATKYFAIGNINLFVKNNPKKALRFYNSGINYMPNDKVILYHRGLCYYELGDKKSAQEDWNRIVALGGFEPEKIDKKTAGMKGFKEMNEILTSK